jgi:hypothetical protein
MSDKIYSRPGNDKYREEYDRIFGKIQTKETCLWNLVARCDTRFITLVECIKCDIYQDYKEGTNGCNN